MPPRVGVGKPKDLTFCFTAMTTNLAELPGVVDLAADLGVPMVYAQPMEVDAPDIFERIGAYQLTNMPLSEIYAISEQALARGRARGVTVDLAGILRPPKPGQKAEAADLDQPIDADEIARDIQHCQYPYIEAFQYLRSGDRFRVLPCCFMSEDVADTMAERYGLEFDAPPGVVELYNSEAFWRFRTDLAEGKAGDLCGNCLQARTFPWRGGE